MTVLLRGTSFNSDRNSALCVSTRSQVSHERLHNRVMFDHRLVVCRSTVVLKFWLDHVYAGRKSVQVYVNLLLQELSSISILPTLPWHSMVGRQAISRRLLAS